MTTETAPAECAARRLQAALADELVHLRDADQQEYLLRIHTLAVREVIDARAEQRYEALKDRGNW